MMREIVIHRHTTEDRKLFQPAFDTGKARQGADSHIGCHTRMPRGGQSGERVKRVMLSEQSPDDPPDRMAFEHDIECAEIRGRISKTPLLYPIRTEGLYGRPEAHPQHLVDHRVRGRPDEQPLTGYDADQVVKLSLDSRQIREDICMVKFDIGDHQGARTVVDELGPFIKKRRIVFIRLHHEAAAAAEPGGHIEIQGNPTDEKPRRMTRVLQDPGHHAGRRGFTVGAGHGEHPAILQHLLG